jgi:2',3'-cyclic-nucleotide 2'-phosphodiesterase (5'-nucleotidase family)
VPPAYSSGSWSICSSSSSSADAVNTSTYSISIVHFNDFYILEGVNSSGKIYGGVRRLATFLESYPDALLVFSGDCFYPSVMSTVTQGEQMVTAFNTLGVTVAVPGNHEFDKGIGHATQLFEQCSFPWLLANMVQPGTQTPVAGLSGYYIIEQNGMKVGFIGLVGDWRTLTSFGAPVEYIDLTVKGQELAQLLRNHYQVDVVIAVTHALVADDLRLLQAVPEIDLVLGGHDHALMANLHQGGEIIWKSGSDLQNVGLINITVVRPNAVQVRTASFPLNQNVSFATGPIQVVTDYYLNLINGNGSLSQQVIGVAAAPIDVVTADVRNIETNCGDYFADILRYRALEIIPSQNLTAPVVSVLNGGGLRLGYTITNGTTITVALVWSIYPFQNAVGAIRINGTVVNAMLDHSCSLQGTSNGGFLSISNLRYICDTTAPVGSKVANLTLGNGTPIYPNTTVILFASQYVLNGGDNYNMLVGAPEVLWSESEIDQDIFINYIKKNPVVAPQVDGRIQLKTSKRALVEALKDYSIEEIEAVLTSKRTNFVDLSFENEPLQEHGGHGH